jgi:hypothetical protein
MNLKRGSLLERVQDWKITFKSNVRFGIIVLKFKQDELNPVGYYNYSITREHHILLGNLQKENPIYVCLNIPLQQ